jgi:ribosome-associated translation inhibitor RaiA
MHSVHLVADKLARQVKRHRDKRRRRRTTAKASERAAEAAS